MKGITLVETLVAIGIFSLGIVGVTMLFSKAWKTNSFILEEGNATAGASRALTDTTKSLRKVKQADDGSYPIKSVGQFDLTVYLDDDGDGETEKVHYFLDNNGNFKKGISEPSGNPAIYPSEDQTVKTLARYIVNTSSEPIFYYYNKDYPIDTINNPLINPQVGDVRLIKIHLWVNIKPTTAPDNINMETFVELRNLNENN